MVCLAEIDLREGESMGCMRSLSGRYDVQTLGRMPHGCIKIKKQYQAVRLLQGRFTDADGMEVSWKE